MRQLSARTGACLVAIALSIGLVACGSSSYKNSSSATSASGTATTAEEDTPTPTSAPPVPAAVTNGKATIDVKVGTDDFTTTKGTRVVSVPKGTSVTINLTATDAEDYHLHGYDIEQKAVPGKTSTFEFTADQTRSTRMSGERGFGCVAVGVVSAR
jgi:heme/copper-type cytochrome/quinol oxidase subunit 2